MSIHWTPLKAFKEWEGLGGYRKGIQDAYLAGVAWQSEQDKQELGFMRSKDPKIIAVAEAALVWRQAWEEQEPVAPISIKLARAEGALVTAVDALGRNA